MDIKFKITTWRTAAITNDIRLSFSVRDNMSLESTADAQSIDVEFSIDNSTDAAFKHLSDATAHGTMYENIPALLSDDLGQIIGLLDVSRIETTCNSIKYFATFKYGGTAWVNELKPLCEYNYGTTTHDAGIIENNWNSAPLNFTVGDSPIWHNVIYYGEPQESTHFTLQEAVPSIYIRHILEVAIYAPIRSLGLQIQAPFFDTNWFGRLLHQYMPFKINSFEWEGSKNIYASDAICSCFYQLNDDAGIGNGINIINPQGEFMPYYVGNPPTKYTNGTSDIYLEANPTNCLVDSLLHPVVPSSSFDNISGQYAKFIASAAGYYRIDARYSGAANTTSGGQTGFIYSINGSLVYKLTFSNFFAFAVSEDRVVYLNVGDSIQWARYDHLNVGAGTTTYASGRLFTMRITKINTIADGTQYNTNQLMPCDNARDLLKGLMAMFNLVTWQKDNTVYFAPFSDAILSTGETVTGFYSNAVKGLDLGDTDEYIDTFIPSENSSYLFSYKDDDKDKNIDGGQYTSLDYSTGLSGEQKSMDNPYFAPTYSENGICYAIGTEITKPQSTWERVYKPTPRILFKYGLIPQNWYFNSASNNFGRIPLAFMYDLQIQVNYLGYFNTPTVNGVTIAGSGLVDTFWRDWLAFAKTVRARELKVNAVHFTDIDLRGFVFHKGAKWLVEEVTNVDTDCENGERMDVKLSRFDIE